MHPGGNAIGELILLHQIIIAAVLDGDIAGIGRHIIASDHAVAHPGETNAIIAAPNAIIDNGQPGKTRDRPADRAISRIPFPHWAAAPLYRVIGLVPGGSGHDRQRMPHLGPLPLGVIDEIIGDSDILHQAIGGGHFHRPIRQMVKNNLADLDVFPTVNHDTPRVGGARQVERHVSDLAAHSVAGGSKHGLRCVRLAPHVRGDLRTLGVEILQPLGQGDLIRHHIFLGRAQRHAQAPLRRQIHGFLQFTGVITAARAERKQRHNLVEFGPIRHSGNGHRGIGTLLLVDVADEPHIGISVRHHHVLLGSIQGLRRRNTPHNSSIEAFLYLLRFRGFTSKFPLGQLGIFFRSVLRFLCFVITEKLT